MYIHIYLYIYICICTYIIGDAGNLFNTIFNDRDIDMIGIGTYIRTNICVFTYLYTYKYTCAHKYTYIDIICHFPRLLIHQQLLQLDLIKIPKPPIHQYTIIIPLLHPYYTLVIPSLYSYNTLIVPL
jgi:hypothetical protein